MTTKFVNSRIVLENAYVAQAAEHFLGKEEVTGSSPVVGSNDESGGNFRTTDITGSIDLQEGVEICMPGDNATFTVELIHPIAIEEGLRFAIREGGRTVGSGVVAKVLK